MVHCSIFGCNNNSFRQKHLSYFRFPRSEEIRQAWIHRCDRKDSDGSKWKPRKNSVICSEHFTPEDFQRNLKSELLNLSGTKKEKTLLKDNAIPSLKLFRNRVTASKSRSNRAIDKLEHARLIISVSDQEKPCTSSSVNMRDVETTSISVPSSPVPSEEHQEDEAEDSDFEICQMNETSESSDESECPLPVYDCYTDQCFLVYGKNLERLIKFCSECGNPISRETMKRDFIGSMVRFRYECLVGHKVTWCSQPQIGKLPLGDLSMTTALCLTGNTYTRMKDIAENMNFRIHSKTTHQNLTNKYIISATNSAFHSLQKEVFSTVVEQDNIFLIGDGR